MIDRTSRSSLGTCPRLRTFPRRALVHLTWLAIVSCSPETPAGDGPAAPIEIAQERAQDGGHAPTEQCAVDERGAVRMVVQGKTERGRTVTLRRSFGEPAAEDFLMREELQVDGEALHTAVMRGSAARFELDVVFGASVVGVYTLGYAVGGGVFAGEVNGRSTLTVPVEEVTPDALTFADGSPLPAAHYPVDVEGLRPGLLREMKALAERCAEERGSGPDAPDTGERREPVSGGWGGSYDPGHDSDPQTTWECDFCQASCHITQGICIASVIAGCTWTGPFGFLCGIGGIAGCIGSFGGCMAACQALWCCPVGCGGLNVCCFGGEKCLNSTVGLCCSEGRSPCHGVSCCGASELCIPSGDMRGLCCRPENFCVDTCCTDAEACIPEGPNAGTCCEPDQVCGGACCGSDQTCLPDGAFEEDVCCDEEHACGEECCDDLEACNPETGRCCGFLSPPCGAGCCEVGDVCLGEETCCPSQRACGDVCCPEGSACDPDSDSCTEPCPDGGSFCLETETCCPSGTFCSPVAGVCCGEGEYYCDGGCRPQDECVK